MDLQLYLRALRRYWWLVAMMAVIGGALSSVMMLRATPVYASTVTFWATTPDSPDTSLLQGDQFGQQRVNSYVKLLSSQRLAESILERHRDLDLTPPRLMRKISGKADLNTVLFTATVRDSSPERGLEIVTAVATEFPGLVDDIESAGGTKDPPVTLEVVSGPSTNPYPVSPKKKLGVVVGLFLGLVAGVGLALLRMLLDRSIRTVEVLEEVAHSPVVGTIPFDALAKKAPLITDAGHQSIRGEAFRQLRTNLSFVDVEDPVRVLVVTSPAPGEGKSITSTNLALTFAEAGKRVLLVEADLRRPKVADYLGLEGSVGLTNVLVGQADIDDVLQTWGPSRLTVLPSGSTPPNPSELLGSQPMDELVLELRRRFELVIIDTPPLLPVTDAAVMSTRADGAVVVVRYGKTRRTDLERAVTSLRAVDARILGTILNRSPNKGVDAHRYDSYEYTPDKRRGAPRSETPAPAARAMVQRVRTLMSRLGLISPSRTPSS